MSRTLLTKNRADIMVSSQNDLMINYELKMKVLFVCLLTLFLMCLGAFLMLTAQFARLGLGEPGTGMSMEEFYRINEAIRISPWGPFLITEVGRVLLILSPVLLILWLWHRRRNRKTVKSQFPANPP